MGRALRVGDAAPPFQALGHDGRTWSGRDFEGRAFVLYFYPQDETPGCTREARAFREAWDEFQALGVPVVGVSRDDPESHRRFAEAGCLPFLLLCDADGAMARGFGATMLGGLPRRVSYLVGPDARVAAVYDSHLRPEAHAERMLEAARAFSRRTSG